MKGFVLQFGEIDVVDSHMFEDNVQIEQEMLADNIKLTCYRCGLHDTYISHKIGESLLIMVGYISEALFIPHFVTQQMACKMLHAFFDLRHSENDFLENIPKVNGSFSFIYAKFDEKTVYTVTDRIGSRPIWYLNSGRSLYLGSHCIPLSKITGDKEFSAGSLAAYFLYGAQVDPSKSIFRNIFAQAEGTIQIKKWNKPIVNLKWYQFKHNPDENRSMKYWAELLANRFVLAGKRILKTTEKPLIFFSGGIDSRLTAASIIAAGGTPVLCTLGDSVNLEIMVAKLAAYILKCEHKIILRDEEWYLRNLKNSIYYTNGIYDWTHSHFSQAYLKTANECDVDSVLTGDFCEAFSKLFFKIKDHEVSIWNSDKFLKQFDSLPLANYRPINRSRTLNLFEQEYRYLAEKQLGENIIDRYEHIKGVSIDPLIVGDYFFRWQNASCLATFQMFNDIRSVSQERNMMFDKELHDTLEILPSYVRNSSGFGSKIIKEIMPMLSVIPNSNTLMPLIFPEIIHQSSKRIRPVLGKLKRTIFTDNHKTTGSWSHLPLLYSKHPSWKANIESIFMDSRKTLPADIFKPKMVEACWNNFCAGDISLHTDIERIVGFSLFNQLLFE